MKKLFILIAAVATMLTANAGLNVTFKGFAGDSVSVRTLNAAGNKRLAPDTVMIAAAGALQLPDRDKPACYRLAPTTVAKSVSFEAFVLPGENVKYTIEQTAEGQYKEELTGSSLNDMMKPLTDSLAVAAARVDAAEGDERKALIAKYYKIMPDYVDANLDGILTLWALKQCQKQYIMATLPKVGEVAKGSVFGDLYAVLEKNVARWEEIEAAKRATANGEPAPDFTLPQPDGTAFSLSSLRGKWVILDFWGTWCRWCIKGIPQMKENYEKMKDRLEIVSIACRDKKERWLAGIDHYGLNWVNVISLEPVAATGKKVEQMYGVEGYPTKLLISPDGKVVNRTVGEKPDFYDIVAELMK